jgi:C4-dicarboxylate-binding protein DctP
LARPQPRGRLKSARPRFTTAPSTRASGEGRPPLATEHCRSAAGSPDIQGQKIRTQGGAPIQVDPLKKLGAIPVSLPLGEALPAMQNRTIDGMVAAAAPFVAFKYYDIAKPMTYMPTTLFAAPVVVNRQFLKSLGPELEAIVRAEARKAEAVFLDWNVNDIKDKEEVWKKNGGEVITMAPPEAKKYVDLVTPVAASILSANPKVKDDYELCSRRRKSTGNRSWS